MPVYRYSGHDRQGKKKTGKISSESQKLAIAKLREKGIATTSIEEMQGVLYKEIKFKLKRIKTKDFILYIRQFSTLIKAGISVVDCTRILAKQATNKTLQQALSEIVAGLEDGSPFSYLAGMHRKIFPPLFTNMLKAGEMGGNMDEILDRLATYYEKQYRTIRKVKAALTYPIFVGISSIGIVIFLLATVVPAFTQMFQSFHAKLPAITLFVIHLGNFFKHTWWVFFFILLILSVFLMVMSNHRKTKYYLDYFLLKTPILGPVVQKAALAKMARTLSSLFSSSVPILQAISIVEKIVGNEVMAKVLRESRNSLERGGSLATPMENHWVFPPMMANMIIIGEKSGSLDLILDKAADFYEAEVDQTTEQIKSLIEPIMILFLAGVVGTIVGSIAIPMFDIFKDIK